MTNWRVHPVILSGGTGTRLWPMSRPDYPKQFLPLIGDSTMLQQTAERVRASEHFGAPLIVCNNEHRFVVAEQLRAVGVDPEAIVLEPVGRNTAPAVAAAALLLFAKDPDAVLLVLPSDHIVTDLPPFFAAVERAHAVAQQGRLALFGMSADRPEVGFGYIVRGDELADVDAAYAVERFVEKPDVTVAKSLIAAGDAYWNSGMFLFGARIFLEELERFEPEILACAREAVAGIHRDLDFCRMDEAAFKAAPAMSIDNAVMERTDRAAVIRATFGWSDVGSWSALSDLGPHDAGGNVVVGDVVAHGTKGCYIRSHERLVATVGIENLIIVATGDAVLVADRARAQDVKELVADLQAQGRDEAFERARVYRPWGYYECIEASSRFQVKHIQVKPGARLSLQMHHHRSEHWVVVSGTAKVTRDAESFLVRETESVYIPCGTQHRLENPGKIPLDLIEVQTGSYLGEDDIIRLDDVYGRL